jgi:hypothetical protein
MIVTSRYVFCGAVRRYGEHSSSFLLEMLLEQSEELLRIGIAQGYNLSIKQIGRHSNDVGWDILPW